MSGAEEEAINIKKIREINPVLFSLLDLPSTGQTSTSKRTKAEQNLTKSSCRKRSSINLEKENDLTKSNNIMPTISSEEIDVLSVNKRSKPFHIHQLSCSNDIFKFVKRDIDSTRFNLKIDTDSSSLSIDLPRHLGSDAVCPMKALTLDMSNFKSGQNPKVTDIAFSDWESFNPDNQMFSMKKRKKLKKRRGKNSSSIKTSNDNKTASSSIKWLEKCSNSIIYPNINDNVYKLLITTKELFEQLTVNLNLCSDKGSFIKLKPDPCMHRISNSDSVIKNRSSSADDQKSSAWTSQSQEIHYNDGKLQLKFRAKYGTTMYEDAANCCVKKLLDKIQSKISNEESMLDFHKSQKLIKVPF